MLVASLMHILVLQLQLLKMKTYLSTFFVAERPREAKQLVGLGWSEFLAIVEFQS